MECVVKIEEAPLPAVPLPDALAGARSLTSSEAPPLALSLPGDDAPTRELRVATEASEEGE